jgi:DNA replication ATP-dependent helicase Dna2
MKEELTQLRDEVREERRLLYEHMQKQWDKPLPERVDSGRALSQLEITEIDHEKHLIHFLPSCEDFAFFSEQQRLRLSQNDPTDSFFRITFLGLTSKGLSVYCSQCDDLAFTSKTGWVLDEDLVDLSDFYFRAISALEAEAHGRDNVFPVLFGEADSEIVAETYDDAMDALEEADTILDETQIDAIAEALASSPFHLIQGPPGTGKTFTLARLVERLVLENHRILVTGFTHRSIHNALKKIHQLLDGLCPVVKISAPVQSTEEDLPFETFPNLAKSGLDQNDGPYVIGATPFALFSSRLDTSHFDSAVIDETSQMTVPSAIMAMMRSDRWFFFGDHQQLPPVSFLHQDNPAEASVFSHLVRHKKPTLLSTTYRLNAPLAHWPSEQFYHGELRSAVPHHRLAFKQPPKQYSKSLDPANSLVRMVVDSPGSRSRNDEEADHVAQIIHELLTSGINPEEIGVVTPFRAQASRIRTLLRGDRFKVRFPNVWKMITVDTVERFQGQEREVILYSFASSDPAFIRKLGNFLFQPARLNVAVTRARTKVILLHSEDLADYARKLPYGSEAAAVFISLLDEAVNITTTTHTTPTSGSPIS